MGSKKSAQEWIKGSVFFFKNIHTAGKVIFADFTGSSFVSLNPQPKLEAHMGQCDVYHPGEIINHRTRLQIHGLFAHQVSSHFSLAAGAYHRNIRLQLFTNEIDDCNHGYLLDWDGVSDLSII